jgi:hypothetical protein
MYPQYSTMGGSDRAVSTAFYSSLENGAIPSKPVRSTNSTKISHKSSGFHFAIFCGVSITCCFISPLL